MFSLLRKTKSRGKPLPEPQESSPPAAPAAETGDSVARVAIAEDGEIVHASPSFHTLAGRKQGTLRKMRATEVFKLPEGDDALRYINAGTRKVFMNGGSKPLAFHFEWMTAPDSRRYLIGSEIAGEAVDEDSREIVESGIFQSRPDSSAIDTPDDLRHFMDMTRDIMLVADPSGALHRANDPFCALFGYPRGDIGMLNLADLFHPEDRDYAAKAAQALHAAEARETEPAFDFQARVLTKAGDERWMEWRQMRRNGQIYALGRDVTAIKHQERVLSRRAEQLKEAESIGNMGHWRWKIGEETIEWSDEIYRIFGVTRAEFTPTLENMNAKIHRRDISKVDQAFQRAIIEQNNYDVEFRIHRKDGEIRHIHSEGRCALNSEGEVTVLYGIMQDLTARVLHERDLQEAKDAAERAYAAKSQFLANMSHELRTPLNAILGFSEIIERQILGPVGTPKYLEYVKGIHESGEHLLDLISDILDMSKIEAGKYELMLEEVNVVKIIHLAVHMIQGRAVDSAVKISLEKFPKEDIVIVADRRALLQIMLNLLSNAVKFSHKGGTVSIECLARADSISLKIIDKGIGIPANKLASITRPFEQAFSHYTRQHEGTGLGLSITKELAEMHGGALLIDSTAGVGTTVIVRMPRNAGKTATAK